MSDPAFPRLPEEFYIKHPNGTEQVSYQDVNGRFWIEYYYPDGTYKLMTTDSGDPNDLTEWREAEPEDGEPISRSVIHQEESRPLEETTPLFGPGDQTPDPPDDPMSLPGHWDPVGLRWVPDEPTSSVGKVLDDDTPWDQPREGQPTMRSGASLDDDSEDAQGTGDEGGTGGSLDPSIPFDPGSTPTSAEGTAARPYLEPPPEEGGAGGAEQGGAGDGVPIPPDPLAPDPWDQPFDPGSTPTSVEGTAAAQPSFPWDEPREGQPTTRSGASLDDDSVVTEHSGDEGGGAGGGVDSSIPAPEGLGGAAGIGVPYQDYIPFFPMVEDPATGEWRPDFSGLGEEDQPPPASQTPESESPVQPTTPPGGDDEGVGGPGVPYQDYIPFWPMTQDPATGEWRNMTPDELEGPQSPDPGSPQSLSNLFDPTAPGATLDPALFDPNAPGPTLDPRLVLDPSSPAPNLDPALLDPLAPGPTLDAALLDPASPGPTVDPNLLDPLAPGETVDPALLDPAAPGPTLDPEQLEQGIAEPSLGVAEPAGVTDQGFGDLGPTEQPPQEPGAAPGHDLNDYQSGIA